jgi:hypothetical protein
VQEAFPAIVYFLCFAASAACAWQLLGSYRRNGVRLLLWSGLCFLFLAGNNLLLMADLLVFQDLDLRLPRHLMALTAVSVLLFGFIWDLEQEG